MLINSYFVRNSTRVKCEQLTAVQESSTREFIVVVKSMGLSEGIRSSKYDNNMARRGHNYMPCLRQADKGGE